MKQILSFVILLLFPSLMVQANDAVYYASGSFLFPDFVTQKTCIL